MLTVFFLLAVVAFICAIMSATGKCPLWVSVLILAIIELLRNIPLGK